MKINKKNIMCYDKNALQRISKLCNESVLNIIYMNENPVKILMTCVTHGIVPVVATKYNIIVQ